MSEEGLAEFVAFFLETCIDQFKFMESLVKPDLLRTRIGMWAEEEPRLGRLPPKARDVLEAVLYRGELPRGVVQEITESTDRHARRITSPLIALGVLASDGPRDALRLAFPAALASRWMPGLFPDKES